ncbi:MAG: thioesterase family protein [Microthrixaceae bacterium]
MSPATGSDDRSGRFGRATAVDRRSDGRHAATIAEGWDIMGNTNGGYLLALVGAALRDTTGRPDPVTVTAHYLAPGHAGPATIDTAIVRSGRRFTTATATLRDEQRDLLSVLATYGDLGDGPDRAGGAAASPELVRGAPPDLPPIEDCVPIVAEPPFPPPFMAQIELRLHPEDARFAHGEPSGTPLLRGWWRLRDDEVPDTVALLCAVDSFPPTIVNADVPLAWTPTIELTAHIRARPAPGWLGCIFSTRFLTGGFLEVDGEVWDTEGHLVAQSRQLALVPRV